MNENCYHLCLFYSNAVHPRIIEKDFESIYEIDLITRQFDDEENFRRKRSSDIARCQYSLYNYINKMKKKGVKGEKLNGEIYIVKNGQYIRPFYKSTAMTPLQLINSITDKLDKERDNNLLKNFISNYKDFLYTDFTMVRGFQKYNENIRQYQTKKVDSRLNENDFQKNLSIINEALLCFYDRRTRTIDERHLFLYRQMSDYLDNHIKAMRKKEEELKNAAEKKVNFIEQNHTNPPENKYYTTEEENIDSSLISFDDLPKIMKEYEEKEKQRILSDPYRFQFKRYDELINDYNLEQKKLKEILQEEYLKREEEEIRKLFGDKYYLESDGQVHFTKTEENRDREELPDNYENEGHKYR